MEEAVTGIPVAFQVGVGIFAALAAVFFFAKYREAAAALEVSEKVKKKYSRELDRLQDVAKLRVVRDALLSEPGDHVDDEGHQHLLLRDADGKLFHVSLQKTVAPAEGEVAITRNGERVVLQEPR